MTATDIKDDLVIEVAYHAIDRLKDWGKYDIALTLSRIVAARSGEAFGEEDQRTLNAVNYVGSFLQKTHKYQDASEVFQALLPVCEKVLGQNNALTMRVRHNLGFVLSALGKDEALPYLEAALEYRRKHGSEEEISTALGSIGMYWTLRKPQQAIPYLQESLGIRRKVFYSNAPELFLAYQNLAQAHLNCGDLEKAESLIAEAESCSKLLIKHQHPYFFGILYLRIDILAAKQDLQGALSVAEGLLQLLQEAKCNDTLEYIAVLSRIAQFNMELENWGKAEQHWREVLAFAEVQQSRPQARWNWAINLVACLDAQECHVKAWGVLQAELQRLQTQIPVDDFMEVLGSTARICYKTGYLERAEPLYRWCITTERQRCGEQSAEHAFWLNGLATVLLHLKRPAEALPLLLSTITIFSSPSAPVDHHHALPESYLNLGTIQWGEEKLAEAQASLELAIALSEQPLYQHVRHHIQGLAQAHLAQLFAQCGNPAASHHAALALPLLQKSFLPDHPIHAVIQKIASGNAMAVPPESLYQRVSSTFYRAITATIKVFR